MLFHVLRLFINLSSLQFDVLINDDGRACIYSFGLSIIRDPLAQEKEIPDNVNVGTLDYLAPEILLPKGLTFDTAKRSMATDIYAFAISLHQVVFQNSFGFSSHRFHLDIQ